MALVVDNTPNWSGTLAVGDGSTATINGPIQGGGAPIQGTGAVLGDNTIYTGGGGGGGTYTGPSAAQIAAAQAESNRIANASRNRDTSRDNTVAGGQTVLGGKASEYDVNNRNFVNGIIDSQNTINTGRANNQLNLRRSMSSIASGVRQGLRSGGVQLANMGASDSGAAQAMAAAYAKEGNAQTNDANSQAYMVDQGLNDQQAIVTRNKDNGMSDFQTWKNNETSRIGNGLRSDLNTLNAQAQADGISGVDMGIVDQLIGNALSQMAAVDARSQQALAGVAGLTPEQASAKAAQLDLAGAVGSNPFSTGNVDMFDNANQSPSGAPITQIPLTVNRRRY